MRNALAYVLNNSRKHAAQRGKKLARRWLDPYSSAAQLDGWKGGYTELDFRDVGPPVGRAPQTWLLRVGWRRHGLIPVEEVPGPGA